GLDTDGNLLVGEPALNQKIHAPERTITSIKRRMGSPDKVRLGDEEHTPQEISAIILRHLTERASRRLGEPVRKAVITIPAYFNDAQRQATREAGQLAGLEVLRLLHEPTAAALAYGVDRALGGSGADGRRILVYDMGGGTFDVSLVEFHRGVVEVRASHGDTQLGGDDFDRLLLEHVAERFRADHDIDLLASARSRFHLLRSVQAAKHRLSTQPFVRLEEEFVAEKDGKPLHLSLEVSRHEYEDLIRPLVERSMESVQTALHDAGTLARDVDLIVLVGGSTRTPLIQSELRERTGVEPRFHIDPDLCVALGAASHAASIAGDDVHGVLVDITPHSLGIRCLDSGNPNHFSRVITKGTPLPASRSDVYYTFSHGQKKAEIKVYQGEHAEADRNTKLGDFIVEGLDPEQSAGSPLVVDFQLTLDGILEVTAKEKATGVNNHITISDVLHSFGEEELGAARKRLDRLLGAEESPAMEGRTDATTRPTTSDPNEQILTTLSRTEALLGKMAGEDREEAVGLMERARRGLDAGQVEEARKAQRELDEILFYVEESRA
ncbi:MAG: Hsp70 family protein, partial [Planctomycetota bacterium]|nr:Hsp70 family protein [Planctomycetota bacterium]